MKKIGKILCLALAIMLVLALVGCGETQTPAPAPSEAPSAAPSAAPSEAPSAAPVATQDPVTLTYSTNNAATHFMSAIDVEMFDKINTETNGAVTIKPYWSETLAKSTEWYTEITRKTADIINVVSGTNQENLPIYSQSTNFFFEIMDMTDLAAASKELWEVCPEIMADWEDSNMMPLVSMTAGQAWLYTLKPVDSLDDIKGMTIRINDNNTENLVRSLGANPVRMVMSETYSALQNKVVDGIIIAFDALKNSNLGDVCKYAVGLPFSTSYSVLRVTNLETWNSLAPETQETIKANHDWWESTYIEQRKLLDEETYTYADENSVEFNTLSAEDEQAVIDIISEFVGSAAEEAGVLDMYNTAREIAAKYVD